MDETPKRISVLTYDEAVKRMSHAAAVVKLICGVANNAAWLTVLDAHDHARRCPNYKHEVKHKFKAAIQALRDYERTLLHSSENRMFHLADMTEQFRKNTATSQTESFTIFGRGPEAQPTSAHAHCSRRFKTNTGSAWSVSTFLKPITWRG